jgi:hypothetical protein
MSEVGGASRENAVPEISFYYDTYTITSGMALTINHGLPKAPRFVWLRLKCLTAEQGYAVGDLVHLSPFSVASGTDGVAVAANSTQIKVVLQTLPAVVNFSTNTPAVITAANWDLVVHAEV